MKTRIALAAFAAAAVAGLAQAEFAPGNFVGVTGHASGSPNPDIVDTGWGTGYDQGQHQLGGVSNYWDAVYGPSLPVFVTSSVVNPYSVIFTIDFSQFVASDYTLYSFDITGLKSDGSILGVAGGATGGTGGFSTDGNNVHWEGTISDLANSGFVLSFKIYQAPAPGALALLGLVGAAGVRRRRA